MNEENIRQLREERVRHEAAAQSVEHVEIYVVEVEDSHVRQVREILATHSDFAVGS
jgi:hypothetical protein